MKIPLSLSAHLSTVLSTCITQPCRHSHALWLLTLFILLLGLSSYSYSAYALPKHHPVPGGVCILPLAPTIMPKPHVHFAGKRITTVEDNGEWKAVIGIPLETDSGQQQLTVRNPTTQQVTQRSFMVEKKQYRTQRLTIKDQSRVNPSGTHLQRILREKQLKTQLRQTFSPNLPNFNIIRPLKGRDTGRFGLRRFINGQPRNPHSGMDLAAPIGTPIRNVSAGQVIYTGRLFFSGNVVYIDHGEGLISMYAHLNKIHVRQGQQLAQGEILGTVGKTGRATGPHLHWSMYLNGAAVNPTLFL
ncbi:MAG: peptidoglycan DD-metalloendopeptidase family protein [bacterium]